MIVSALLLQLAHGVAAATLAHPVPDCSRTQGQEIVVCGSRNSLSRYRLPKLADGYEPRPIRAEGNVIPGVHMRAHVEEDHQAYGFVSKKLLVTFSTPF